jgi:hypothetical protein
MKTYLFGAALFLCLFVAAPLTRAATLTDAQVQAILSLLSSFGADSSTVANVQSALMNTSSPSGSPSNMWQAQDMPINTLSPITGGSCPSGQSVDSTGRCTSQVPLTPTPVYPQQQFIHVLYPTAGIMLPVGQPSTISWRATEPNAVYEVGDIDTFSAAAAHCDTGNVCSVTWTPSSVTSSLRIGIYDTVSGLRGVSDAFAIGVPQMRTQSLGWRRFPPYSSR